jgi:hypothetical protein
VAGNVSALQGAGQASFIDPDDRVADLPARPHGATLGPPACPGPAPFRSALDASPVTANELTPGSE